MYSEEAVEVFLKDQSRLYDEPVAEIARTCAGIFVKR